MVPHLLLLLAFEVDNFLFLGLELPVFNAARFLRKEHEVDLFGNYLL